MPKIRGLSKWFWNGGYIMPGEVYTLTNAGAQMLLSRRDSEGNPVAELVRDEREVAMAGGYEKATAAKPKRRASRGKHT